MLFIPWSRLITSYCILGFYFNVIPWNVMEKLPLWCDLEVIRCGEFRASINVSGYYLKVEMFVDISYCIQDM